MSKYFVVTGLICLFSAASAIQTGCSKSDKLDSFEKTDEYTPYQPTPEDSVIVTGEATYVGPTEAIPEEGQITVGGETVDTAEGKFCSDPNAKMDVITVDGKVVDVICYPPPTPENTTEVTVQQGNTEAPAKKGDAQVVAQQGNIDVPQNANNTVIVFDQATDGINIEGDVSVDGNNVAIYGNGPDKTIIDGDLVISGNNARVRGVRVKGNVILDLNNVALLFCIVEGNVEVRKNNVTVAATDVFGDMKVLGNNAVLVQNRVQGNWEIEGSEEFCDGNLSFNDDDNDVIVDSNELGDAIACK